MVRSICLYKTCRLETLNLSEVPLNHDVLVELSLKHQGQLRNTPLWVPPYICVLQMVYAKFHTNNMILIYDLSTFCLHLWGAIRGAACMKCILKCQHVPQLPYKCQHVPQLPYQCQYVPKLGTQNWFEMSYDAKGHG